MNPIAILSKWLSGKKAILAGAALVINAFIAFGDSPKPDVGVLVNGVLTGLAVIFVRLGVTKSGK